MVLIDMQKPKSCDECRFCEYEQGHCTALPVGEWRRIEDVSECPLVDIKDCSFIFPKSVKFLREKGTWNEDEIL